MPGHVLQEGPSAGEVFSADTALAGGGGPSPADVGLVDAVGVVEKEVRHALALDELECPEKRSTVPFQI